MHMGLINNGVRLKRLKNAVAAGQTDIKSDGVDVSNVDVVTFLVLLGTVTDSGSGNSIKLQQSVDDVDGDYNDILGSKTVIVDADDNKVLRIEVVRPKQSSGKWMRVYVDLSTANLVLDGILVELSCTRTAPAANDTTESANSGKIMISPALGTA